MQTSSGPNKNTAEQNAVNQLMQSQDYNDFINKFKVIITRKVMQGKATDKASKTSKILKLFVNTIRESINKDPSQKDSNLVNAIKNIEYYNLINIITQGGVSLEMKNRNHTEGIDNLMKLINEDLETQNPGSIAQQPKHNGVGRDWELGTAPIC